MLVVVAWGEARQPALARIVARTGDRVRVEKWKPAMKFGEAPRDWAKPKAIPARDVLREATSDDLAHFGALYPGCGRCYGADPGCSCNPAAVA